MYATGVSRREVSQRELARYTASCCAGRLRLVGLRLLTLTLGLKVERVSARKSPLGASRTTENVELTPVSDQRSLRALLSVCRHRPEAHLSHY